MSNKVLKNSFILVIGNLLFRVGGYINRLLMSRMLGPEGYGLYGLTLPFQGIFQILSAGGLPPAISKYVAEYNAQDEKALTRQVIYTATKFMVLMAILLSIILLFSSDFIANSIFHKPLVVWPLRAVSLITPFSVIVGAMRGAFQGVYKNEYTVYNRMAEQLATIVFAVVFVYCGLYAMGAVLGGAFGFIVSAITAVLLYKKYISPMFYSEDSLDLSLREELNLLWMLICFAVPVAITALSEMAIYDVGTLVIGIFMLSTDVGFYNAADPISEYVVDCLRYCILTVIPMCVVISMFSIPIIQLLFGNVYTPGSGVLSILVIGMSFYSVYMISSSILQGTGNPRLPMYILLVGTVVNIALNAVFVNLMGIIGAAIATTITTGILMIVIMLFVIRTTKISIPWKNILLVLACNLILMAVCYLIPKTLIGLIIGIIIGSLIYIVSLIRLKVLTKRDISFFSQYMNKIPIIKKYTPKIVKYIENKGLLYKMDD